HDGEEGPPPLTIRVCDSLSCALAGGERLRVELAARFAAKARVVRAPCMGACHNAPAVAIGHALHEHATTENVVQALVSGTKHPEIPAYIEFEEYRRNGGYALLQACLSGAKPIEEVIATLEGSALRGLGG